jgi:hypothetical protein
MRIWIPLLAFIRIRVTIQPFNLMRSQIWLIILMRIRIQILFLIKEMQVPDHWSTATGPFWAFTTPLRASLAFYSSILSPHIDQFWLWWGPGSGSWFLLRCFDADPDLDSAFTHWSGSESESDFQNDVDSCWSGFGPQQCCYITYAGIKKKTLFKRFKYHTVLVTFRYISASISVPTGSGFDNDWWICSNYKSTEEVTIFCIDV